jgi:2-dehydropantoate 2-reductase
MRIAILGAGAIGGFLGARLAAHGVDVVLIARGPHLAAMRKDGLRLIEPDGESVVRVEATDDFDELRTADAVFVTLKAHSLPGVAERLAANLKTSAVVVGAQNGIPWWYFQRHGGELEGTRLETVDPGGVVARAIDPRNIIGCVVYPATDLIAPGVVNHVEGERFSLGELDGSRTDRVVAIAAALAGAGLKAPVQPRIRQEIWLKLLGNAVFNPIAALTRATLGEIATSELVARLVRAAMEEVDAVARGVSIEIDLSIDKRIGGAARVGEHKPSMLQDLESGRALEIDPIVGSVVELGDRLGVDVPHLRTLYACVKLLEKSALSAR